jgi:putative peptide zinc metalloprotease protein
VTGATGLLQARPQLRPDILVSRRLVRGTAQIHLLLDPSTGARMEVAAKVHFVLDRLDGVRTLDEIGEDYAAHYGARLGEPQWHQLLGLMYGRRLLVGTAPAPEAGSTPASTARARPGLREGRIALVPDTPGLIERLHRLTGFARHPPVLIALLLLLVAQLVGTAAQLPALASATVSLRHRPLMLLAVAAAVWGGMALHELAHGLAGRAAGGRVTELGVRWRLPMVYLYCEVEDVRFLACRRHQVATAAAGALMNLALLLPVSLTLLLLGGSVQGHQVLSALLLTGTAAGLANLLPLPPLDGYRIAEYLLDTVQLAAETRRFAALALAGPVRGGPGAGSYPKRLRRIYGGYAVGWTVLTGALLTALGLLGGQLAPNGYSWPAGLTPPLAVATALVFLARRPRRGTAAAVSDRSGEK